MISYQDRKGHIIQIPNNVMRCLENEHNENMYPPKISV